MRKLRAEMHRRMLGNGYCARPVGLDCHFESICESCTYFQTTLEFRPTLQRQRDDAAEKGQVGRLKIFDGLLDAARRPSQSLMTASARVSLFEVAANPDPDSTLPFLIRLPLPDGELVLKARDSWPRTAKVYCHRAERWPEDPEIVERVPIRSCQRRGVAIDLVLDRPRENRSQLVFTRIQGGREGIFWQSARTTRQARPGIRVPRRRAAELAHLTILVDTRERYPYKFTQQQATTERRALPAGDYGIAHDDQIVAVVERKSLDDLVRRLIDGQLTYALADMASTPARGRRGRGPLLQPVQARAHQARVRDRDARRAHRPLPDRADPLRRDPPARRRMDLPLPRRRARLPPSRTNSERLTPPHQRPSGTRRVAERCP